MKKTVIAISAIALLVASFFIGSHIAEQKSEGKRIANCRTQITFAIDKAENEDLSDPGTMKALISNVYAAYNLCDDNGGAKILHDLWNFLIFEADNDIAFAKEKTLRELNSVLLFV